MTILVVWNHEYLGQEKQAEDNNNRFKKTKKLYASAFLVCKIQYIKRHYVAEYLLLLIVISPLNFDNRSM